MLNIITVMVYLGLGAFFSRLERFPKNTSEILNLLVIYVALPALILEKFPFIAFNSTILVPALSPWFMVLVSALFVLLVSKIFKLERAVTACLMLVIPLGNTSFLGIPMIQGLLGEEAVSYAIIYDQIGSFMALSTYGSAIVAIYSRSTKFEWVPAIKKIITFPPFISLIAAIIFKFVYLPPDFAFKIFAVLGNMLVPLAMMSVGFQFKSGFERSDLPLISGALAFKMVLAPLFLFVCLKFLGRSGLPISTSILEAGMPPQITAGAVAMSAGFAPKLSAALVGLGILFSFVSLPLLKTLLNL